MLTDIFKGARQKIREAQDALYKPYSINLKLIDKGIFSLLHNSADITDLGQLSARYESGGKPGRISSGKGDWGGVSYGSYQFASKTESLKRFLNSDSNLWKTQINHELFLKDKERFNANWQKIAEDHPRGFHNAQHNFVYETHYKPLSDVLKKQKVLDITNRSSALKDSVWSVAVQHGPNSRVIQNALKGKDAAKLTDVNIIKAIYKERRTINSNGNLKYFPKSPTLKRGLLKRFLDEEKRALTMLEPAKKTVPAAH